LAGGGLAGAAAGFAGAAALSPAAGAAPAAGVAAAAPPAGTAAAAGAASGRASTTSFATWQIVVLGGVSIVTPCGSTSLLAGTDSSSSSLLTSYSIESGIWVGRQRTSIRMWSLINVPPLLEPIGRARTRV